MRGVREGWRRHRRSHRRTPPPGRCYGAEGITCRPGGGKSESKRESEAESESLTSRKDFRVNYDDGQSKGPYCRRRETVRVSGRSRL